MTENKKFLLVLAIILTVFFGEKLYKKLQPPKKEKENKIKLTLEKHTYEEKNKLLDINTATLDEMLKKKISISYGKKIIEYVEITGGFEEVKDILRISGIGKKTYDKIKITFEVRTPPRHKKININKATDKELLYLGLNKKEIKITRNHLEKNGRINGSVEAMEILEDEKYQKIKSKIAYD